jgi:hypothetical protein
MAVRGGMGWTISLQHQGLVLTRRTESLDLATPLSLAINASTARAECGAGNCGEKGQAGINYTLVQHRRHSLQMFSMSKTQ